MKMNIFYDKNNSKAFKTFQRIRKEMKKLKFNYLLQMKLIMVLIHYIKMKIFKLLLVKNLRRFM